MQGNAAAQGNPAAPGNAGAPELRPWADGETPALSGKGLDGRTLDLAALRGRVVLVQFWATWCEPCRDEMPALVKLRAVLQGRPFEIVAVNHGEGPARVEQFLRAYGIDLPVLMDRDGDAASAWRVGGIPTAFLVDAGGRVRYRVAGECDWSTGAPAAALERLLGEARSSGKQG